jgi:hypothetical protein
MGYFWGGIVALGLFFWLLNRGIKLGVEHRWKSKLSELELETAQRLEKIEQQRLRLAQIQAAFQESFVKGRRWLTQLVAEASVLEDEIIAQVLERKRRAAYKAAEEVRRVKAEKRALAERAKHFEYLLKNLYEDYPILGDYEADILNDSATLNLGANESPDADLVATFISEEEYRRLAPAERNQVALNKWMTRKKSNVEIGRMYERYIGARYEEEGWAVEYHGATQGLEDLGRDLICKKGGSIRIVQAKYWASHKTIHEKHIFQLYGTSFLYARGIGGAKTVVGHLYCTSQVSDTARDAAKALGVSIVKLTMDHDYPMIKCNINGKDKIYHLPFDQQYDRVRIGTVPGECYVKTAAEAESKGFRRAKRWMTSALGRS